MSSGFHKQQKTDNSVGFSDAEVLEWLCTTSLPKPHSPGLAGLSKDQSEPSTSEKNSTQREVSWYGKHSELVVRFANQQGRSAIVSIEVKGRGPSGQPLATYGTAFKPSPQVSDALVRLLKSLPRNMNIDRYLRDIACLVWADKNNNFIVTTPTRSDEQKKIYPMIVDAPPFSEYCSNPSNLANRWIAKWNEGPVSCTIRGTLTQDASRAVLEVQTLTQSGSTISDVAYDLQPSRKTSPSHAEKYSHLLTLLWEAIEYAGTNGVDALSSNYTPISDDPHSGSVTFGTNHLEPDDRAEEQNDNSTWRSQQDNDDYESILGGEVVLARKNSAGAKVALEVTETKAVISIELPFGSWQTTASFGFEAKKGQESLSETDIVRLKALAADLASEEPSIRSRAVQTIDDEATSSGYDNRCLKALYGPMLGDSHEALLMAWEPLITTSAISESLLRGYHPLFLDPVGTSACPDDMVRGGHLLVELSPKYDIRLEYTHTQKSRFVAHIPAATPGDLATAKQDLKTILSLYDNGSSDSWQPILSYVHDVTKKLHGATLNYHTSPSGMALPRVEDRSGQTALAAADAIVDACRKTSKIIALNSFSASTAQGEATAYIRFNGTPATLGITIRKGAIAGLACYEIPPDKPYAIPTMSLACGAARFSTNEPEKLLAAVVSLCIAFGKRVQASLTDRGFGVSRSSAQLRQLFLSTLESFSGRNP